MTEEKPHCELCGDEILEEDRPVMGRYIWGLLHQTVETMPCRECRERGTAGLRAMHDLANIGLGKPLFDKENFLTVADVYTDVAKKVRESPAVEEQEDAEPAHVAAQRRFLLLDRRRRFLEQMTK